MRCLHIPLCGYVGNAFAPPYLAFNLFNFLPTVIFPGFLAIRIVARAKARRFSVGILGGPPS
jgi:hypothetical protein